MKRLTLILSMMLALIGFNANAAIYIVGDQPFGGWSYNGGTEMTDNQDGSYSITATIDGSVWFVFADGQGTSWDDFNGNYRFGPTGGDETVDVGIEYTTQRGNNGAYKFTGTGDDYVITFNPTTLKFSIAGYVAPIEVTTYNVVGDFNGWDVNADEMTLVNGVYTMTKENIELPAGTFYYKFVGNHDYGIFEYPTGMNNLSEPVEKHGYYDVTITFVPATLEYSCTLTLVEEIVDPIIEDHTYTVAGDNTTLFGSEWDPTDTINDMVLVNGLYTWNKESVTLTAGTIQFKVVMDHDWNNGVNAWPADNYQANIESNGDYDVTITFNEESKEINFTATPVVITDDFYAVAGSPEKVFGTNWNTTINKMTLVDSIYTWTKDSVELTTTDLIEFKVVKNSNWSTCWPTGDNYKYTALENGTYNLVITYNPENDAVLLTATKVGGEEPPVITVYTVAGPEAIFGSNWDATDTNNDMVLDAETGLYTWTADSVALTGSFGFKVVGNHDWANEWPQGYDNNWIVNITEAGTYNLVITFNAETGEINCEATKLGGEVTSFERGDVNMDGEVDINDVTRLIDVVLGKNVEYDPEAADCNVEGGDNSTDINDVTALINRVLKGSWPVPEMVYTVAGPLAIFGSDWDATDTNNDMTLVDGVYTWSKENVALTGNFGFKVVGNHDWANEWPIGYDNNWIAVVEQPGIYTIAITYNPEAAEADRITCTLTKTGDIAPVEHTYTVAGTSNLFGSNWDPTDTNNDMVKGDDGIYTWTRESEYFQDGTKIEFKIVQDHSWDVASWPENNWEFIAEEGAYNFVITFNPNAADNDENKVTCTPTKL